MEQVNTIRERFSRIKPLLSEVQRRYWVAIEAKSLGRGGLSLVAAATGVSRPMIRRGLLEVAQGVQPHPQRQRRVGGGRKALLACDVHLLNELLARIPGERASHQPPALLWVVSSAGQLASGLTAAGHRISAQSVTTLLGQRGYTLRATRAVATAAARQHFAQRYRYLSARAAQFGRCGQPVLYVRAYTSLCYSAGEWRTRPGFTAPEQVLGALRLWWRQHAPAVLPTAQEALLVLDADLDIEKLQDWRVELGRTARSLGVSLQLCTLPPAIHRFRSLRHQASFSAETTFPQKLRQTAEVSLVEPPAGEQPTALREQLYHGCYPQGLIGRVAPRWGLSALK